MGVLLRRHIVARTCEPRKQALGFISASDEVTLLIHHISPHIPHTVSSQTFCRTSTQPRLITVFPFVSHYDTRSAKHREVYGHEQ